MLLVEPERRSTAKEITALLTEISQRCAADKNYAIGKPFEPPSSLLADTGTRDRAEDRMRRYICPIFEAESTAGQRGSCPGGAESTLSGMHQHMKRHHFPNIQLCPYCNGTFLSTNEYETHREGDWPCRNRQKLPASEVLEHAWEELNQKVMEEWLATPFRGVPVQWGPTGDELTREEA